MKLCPVDDELKSNFPVLIGVFDTCIVTQAVNPFEIATKLLYGLIQIQNFSNRSIFDFRFYIVFYVFLWFMITGVFTKAVNRDHVRMKRSKA